MELEQEDSLPLPSLAEDREQHILMLKEVAGTAKEVWPPVVS